MKYVEILAEWLWPADKPRPGPDTVGDMRYAPQPGDAVSSVPSLGSATANGLFFSRPSFLLC